MEIIHAVIAAIIGAALGRVQFKLLRRTVESGKWWLLAVKLPLWAAFMLGAAAASIAALVAFVVGATITFLASGCVYWLQWRKGV